MLKMGDSLLRNQRDDSAAAVQAVKPTFDAFAEAYRLAAEKLLDESITSKHAWDRMFQSLPVVYLIRHYIELTLKAILSQSDQVLGTSRLTSNLHHRLDDLWSETKQAIVAMGINREPEQIAIADELIEELNRLDPLSFSFRYPLDKKTQQPSLTGVASISMSCLKDVHLRFRDFLQGLLDEAYQHPGGSSVF